MGGAYGKLQDSRGLHGKIEYVQIQRAQGASSYTLHSFHVITLTIMNFKEVLATSVTLSFAHVMREMLASPSRVQQRRILF
jgi:hypothetical protein